jgi:crotonobetainyl-CoA:carnitine CoA-transferase CaiB-like acyl-CoA transferase
VMGPTQTGNDGRPLAGLRIIDVGARIAGPYAAALLGDLGADVIKVEGPDGDPLRRLAALTNEHFRFTEANRNKKSVVLDLRSADGQDAFRQLVSVSDIVICNLRPDVITKLGLDYRTLSGVRPDIIALRLSAYGATGPNAGFLGTAPTIDCASGAASVNGYSGGSPLRPPGYYADLTTALFAVLAALAACRQRDATGQGQEIDLAMVEGTLHLLGTAVAEFLNSGVLPGPEGNADAQHLCAPCDTFPCLGEDEWIAISVGDDTEWQRLCRCLDDSTLTGDTRYRTRAARLEHRDELYSELAARTARYRAADLASRITAVGVTVAMVVNPADTPADSLLSERGYFSYIDQLDGGVGPMSRLAFPAPWPGGWQRLSAPRLGEHTNTVLRGAVGDGLAAGDELAAETEVGTTPPEPADGTSRHPLSGVRVIEVNPSVASGYCTHLLFGLGAEVLLLRAEGGASRGPDDYLDRGKAVRQLDPCTAAGRKELAALLAQADVVIDGRGSRTTPATPAEAGWSDQYDIVVQDLGESLWATVRAAISWFGAGVAAVSAPGSELTATARSGYMAMNGVPDDRPLGLSRLQISKQGGLQAAIAVLACLRPGVRAQLSGRPADISVQECGAFLTCEAPLDHYYTGKRRVRDGNRNTASSGGRTYTAILPCGDGHVLITLAGPVALRRLETLAGTSLEGWDDQMREMPGLHPGRLDAYCSVLLQGKTAQQIVREAQAVGLNWSEVLDIRQLIDSDQLRARRFWASEPLPSGEKATVPGPPFRMSECEWRSPAEASRWAPAPVVSG